MCAVMASRLKDVALCMFNNIPFVSTSSKKCGATRASTLTDSYICAKAQT